MAVQAGRWRKFGNRWISEMFTKMSLVVEYDSRATLERVTGELRMSLGQAGELSGVAILTLIVGYFF
jgi:hypothetical protein